MRKPKFDPAMFTLYAVIYLFGVVELAWRYKMRLLLVLLVALSLFKIIYEILH